MTSATSLPDPSRVARDKGITPPCRDPHYDPDAWFPEGNTVTSRRIGKAARHLCAYACPLREVCRDYAIATDERYGIWGGLSESHRATLRRGGRLRDRRVRWLAGLVDHDGNPLPTVEDEQDAGDETPAA